MSIFNILKKGKKEDKEKEKDKKIQSAEINKTQVEKKVDEEKKEVAHDASKIQRESELIAGGKLEQKKIESYRILMQPLVTEKAAQLGIQNKYVFEVASSVNKIEIARAIKSVYHVTPVSVNIISVSGRNVRYGKTRGRTKDWKKAIITLKKGEKIEVYEGV